MRRANRREFLAMPGMIALSGLAGAAQAPSGPNEAITLGFIGVGGMGSGLLNIFKRFPDVRVAAVCDVYEPHALRAREAAGGQPDVHGDFRRVLDRPDIDAVVIATPDHWHAIPTILACQAGKDVYCEKPLGYTIGESGRMRDAAQKAGRITQMGNLIHASETYRRMVEIVQSGILGRVAKVRIWMTPQARDLGNPPDEPPPAGLDYDFWLGPAPQRPFNPNRHHHTWRYFWDYGGGHLSDFVCHLLDPVHWAMDAHAPARVSALGDRYILEDNTETPDTFEVLYDYPDQHFQLVWSHQSHSPHGFENRDAGIMFLGSEATLHGHYNDYTITPNRGNQTIDEPEPTLPRSVGHHREWLDAIKSRTPSSCDFAYGHELTTVGHLGNIALRTGQTLQWDASAQRFVNNEAADEHLWRPVVRAPWELPAG